MRVCMGRERASKETNTARQGRLDTAHVSPRMLKISRPCTARARWWDMPESPHGRMRNAKTRHGVNVRLHLRGVGRDKLADQDSPAARSLWDPTRNGLVPHLARLWIKPARNVSPRCRDEGRQERVACGHMGCGSVLGEPHALRASLPPLSCSPPSPPSTLGFRVRVRGSQL